MSESPKGISNAAVASWLAPAKPKSVKSSTSPAPSPGGRSLRPHPKRSLKAKELMLGNPLLGDKGANKIGLPTRKAPLPPSSSQESSVAADSTTAIPAVISVSACDVAAAPFSPLPSPTVSVSTVATDSGRCTPNGSQGSSRRKKKAQVRAKLVKAASVASAGDARESDFECKYQREDLDFHFRGTQRYIIVPTTKYPEKPQLQRTSSYDSRRTKNGDGINTPPNDAGNTETLSPTFEYYQSNLIPRDEEDDDDDSGPEDPIPALSLSDPLSSDPEKVRRKAKAFLEKEGFYNWSTKRIIEQFDERRKLERQPYYQQRPLYPDAGSKSSASSITSTSSALSGTTAPGRPEPQSQQPLQAERRHFPLIRTIASGRITRSMAHHHPSSTSCRISANNPHQSRPISAHLAADPRRARRDRGAEHRTAVERHRWALRDLVAAREMLATNKGRMEGAATTGPLGEKREEVYGALVEKHLRMLEEIVGDWKDFGGEFGGVEYRSASTVGE